MDKLWFYTKSGTNEKQGPMAESELRELISRGEVTSGDLVWTDGMSEWQPLGTVAELKSGMPALPTVSAALPDGLLGWLGFVAIMNIIYGVFMAISCFGIIHGILTIIAGTALLAGKNALEGVQTVDATLVPFFDKLKTFVQMTGILIILGLVGGLIGIILWFTVFAASMASAMGAS